MSAILILAALAAAPDCAHAVAQRDMTVCAVAQYQGADGALNRQYGVAIAAARQSDAALDRTRDKRPGYEETLRAAQRGWLAYRDAQCRMEGFEMRGGSAESMAVNLCLARVTRARTAELVRLSQPVR